jgi:hypothetical protein
MVGAAEAELGQDLVGIADKIPIGKEQQLDDVPRRLAVAAGAVARLRQTIGG